MHIVISDEKRVEEIVELINNCLLEERIEVRIKAEQVLGGILHCQFIQQANRDKLLVTNFLFYFSI